MLKKMLVVVLAATTAAAVHAMPRAPAAGSVTRYEEIMTGLQVQP